MQKISNIVLQRMIREKLTGMEVNFVLTIARHQADDGSIRGVYYKDIIKELECSAQQFYNMLRNLAAKGIISFSKASYYDYDIRIMDNDFAGAFETDTPNKGYISLSKGLFCKKFMRLKAGAKLLAMELLRRQSIQFKEAHKPSLGYNISNFFRVFCDLLGITRRVLLSYLRDLEEFFSIGRKDGKLYIRPLKSSYEDPPGPSETARYQQNEVRVYCRRNRIDTGDYSRNALEDTANLMSQYRFRALEKGLDIVKLVLISIGESVEQSRRMSAKKRRLEPPLIHKILKQHIHSGYCPE